MESEVSEQRWKIAQQSEEEFWEGYTTGSLLAESGKRYPEKAEILLKEWSAFVKITKNAKILQIGCGPEDVINYFKIGKLYSIDPLADFYKKKFKLDYKKTNLKKAAGEEIPFSDNYFDIVILVNVLDHVHLPDKVLKEIKRVMKPNAIFHFENYTYQTPFIYLAEFYGRLKEISKGEIFNIHHPYMFTIKNLRNLVSNNFSIIKEEIGRDIGLYDNLGQLKEKVKHHKKLRRRMLARIGLLGTINYSCLCKISE